MLSNTGDQRTYEAGDQRPPKLTGPRKGKLENREMYGGPEHIDIEGLDERAIGNKLAEARKKERDPEENTRTVKDPLAPARAHGYKPSRGAHTDAELKAADEQMLKDKGKI
ncbi:hypothetical protein AMATHDRAFT_4558 [Amanita thiersii Skay4041]|uniref:Uncharacterized protein n=1 Tax=Amanita thiersii Skay4041 TaxID=703135 RepID=A0A2A9NQ30_9AGAR|nr:hypothetical protein AMATHDRAFT_4558 [Amanita thiersii Skay4041]